MSDPLETMNRKVFEGNQRFNHAVIYPVAKAYHDVVPEPVRNSVENFAGNLIEPMVFANDVLQLRLGAAATTAGRFAINSTVGVGGLFDVATHQNLPRQTGDLGQTFYVWGMHDSPYLVLPVIGPTNVRDIVGATIQFVATIPAGAALVPTQYATAANNLTVAGSVASPDHLVEQGRRYEGSRGELDRLLFHAAQRGQSEAPGGAARGRSIRAAGPPPAARPVRRRHPRLPSPRCWPCLFLRRRSRSWSPTPSKAGNDGSASRYLPACLPYRPRTRASLLGPIAGHGESTDPAATRIGSFYDALLGTMKQADQLGLKGRYDKLAPVVAKTYDLASMSKMAVGQSWSTLPPQQQASIVNAFTRMTTATYASRFDGFSGEQFEILQTADRPNGDKLVSTQITQSNGKTVALNYLMRKAGADWKVVDVYLDGTISELASRRAEFGAILKSSGPDALVDSLVKRGDKLLSGS